MKTFTRRTEQQPTTGSLTHPPDDWPAGAFNPDSEFFVPEALRPWYTVDRNSEAQMFGIGNPLAREMSSELHPLDYHCVALSITPKALTRAGFQPKQHGDPMVRREFLKMQAAKLTDRDRQLYLHNWRLGRATVAEQRSREAAKMATERRKELTCQVCGNFHRLTRPTRFSHADDPHGAGGPALKATVCPACLELVRQAINDQAAEQLTATGKTRREAARALVRASLTRDPQS